MKTVLSKEIIIYSSTLFIRRLRHKTDSYKWQLVGIHILISDHICTIMPYHTKVRYSYTMVLYKFQRIDMPVGWCGGGGFSTGYSCLNLIIKAILL